MYPLEEATIARLQRDLSDGKVTSRGLVLGYLERIARIDSVPGGLNSVLEVNPEALSIADRLDRMRAEGKVLSGMHGIPVLLKDNINTADRLHTSAGALALKDHFAAQDAFLVSRLREAGALILGKANMTEYANYMSYHMPGGYSSRGGQVICPYDPAVNPMGSSSGSAVSASASLCAAAVGTETSGSILYPAAVNGIVGLKPTAGLISRSGIFPISCTLDTAGPMARTVADAAALLEAIAGEDEADPQTCRSNPQPYTALLDRVPLRGLRIGISRISTQPEAAAQRIQALLSLLQEEGAVLVEVRPFESVDGVQAIMRHEFRAAVDYYLSRERADVATLSDIVLFNQQNAPTALRYGQQRMVDAHNDSSARHIDPPYLQTLIDRERDAQALDALFEEKSLDLILMTDRTNYPAYSGFPALNLPLGRGEDGLPVCSLWMARRFDEARLLAAAHQVEKLLGPRFAPSLG